MEIRENPENPVPEQWYKDEGGRENCVELQVRGVGEVCAELGMLHCLSVGEGWDMFEVGGLET